MIVGSVDVVDIISEKNQNFLYDCRPYANKCKVENIYINV